mmetsp:Transcript_23097/g.26301  ORF Transcript_23097/g.26301 Transcript_23097/m.26301 type:complete len:179 (+) Transcript_23097:247-783(+)
MNTMSGSTQILAAACGPIVTTWDLSKSNSTTSNNNSNISNNNSDNSTTSVIDATSIAIGASINSIGVGKFKPYGNEGSVRDVVWNHNGQVLATCSESLSFPDEHDIALTLYSTQTKLESFSNSNTNKNTNNNNNNKLKHYPTFITIITIYYHLLLEELKHVIRIMVHCPSYVMDMLRL